MQSMSKCTCRGAVPEDPCGHGDTSEGCPVHDPNYCRKCEAWEYGDGIQCDVHGEEALSAAERIAEHTGHDEFLPKGAS